MKNTKQYDLEERTAKFGQDIIMFCQELKQDVISKPIISQIVRSATSVGANYMEANGASSKSDFRNKIHISLKEARETRHWLKMLLTCFPDFKEKVKPLWLENQELILIFSKISNTLNKSK